MGTAGLAGPRTDLNAPLFVFDFEDFAKMGEPVEQSRRHLCITEIGWPFAKIESNGDKVCGALIVPSSQASLSARRVPLVPNIMGF